MKTVNNLPPPTVTIKLTAGGDCIVSSSGDALSGPCSCCEFVRDGCLGSNHQGWTFTSFTNSDPERCSCRLAGIVIFWLVIVDCGQRAPSGQCWNGLPWESIFEWSQGWIWQPGQFITSFKYVIFTFPFHTILQCPNPFAILLWYSEILNFI